MHVAVVIPTRWCFANRVRFSVDIDQYMRALRSSGHSPALVCSLGSEYPSDYPAISVSLTEMLEPACWLRLGFDVAIVFTWLRHAQLLRAIQSSGTRVVSRGDSEGYVGVRGQALRHLREAVVGIKSPIDRIRGAKHWFDRLLIRHRHERESVIASIDAADLTVVETPSAADRLRRMLRRVCREDLSKRIGVLPHFVHDEFLTSDVAMERAPSVVAVGRWDSDQKDGPLLRAVLSRLATKCPNIRATVIGRGATTLLRDCGLRSLDCHDHLDAPEVAGHLRAAQVMLVTSRWESFHIAAHEMLCCGGSLTGPPVTPLPDVCAAGPFGTVASGRRPTAVAEALMAELDAWTGGARDPVGTSTFWRPRMDARVLLPATVERVVVGDVLGNQDSWTRKV